MQVASQRMVRIRPLRCIRLGMGMEIQYSRYGIFFSIDQEKRIIIRKTTVQEPALTTFLTNFWNRFLFLCLLAPFYASAEDTLINAAETLAYGTFSSSERNTYTKGATDEAPPVDSVEKYRFENFTNRIPMILGTEFGIEYQINTKPKGRPISITTIIQFPEAGLKQPGGRKYRKSTETKRVSIGDPQLHGYGFDEPWELVPGEWTFEVWHKKAKLITKTFTIYEPEQSDPSE